MITDRPGGQAFEQLVRFYDDRARNAMNEANARDGSDRLPLAFRAPYRFVEQILADAYGSGCRTLVDVCCGIGLHAVRAARLGYSVTGLDLSPHSIRHAEWLARSSGVADHCRFLVGDALATLEVTEVFDIIFESGSLYYLVADDFRRFLAKHLKPGGYVVCVEANGDNVVADWLRRRRSRLRGDRDLATLTSLLGASDLEQIAADLDDVRLTAFDLFTTFGVTLTRWPRLAVGYHDMARKVDTVVLRNRGARGLAFKFVLEARRSPAQQVKTDL